MSEFVALPYSVAESDLAGMPLDWISRHRRDGQGRAILTLQYPDFFPVITYAENRSLRQRMVTGFLDRGRGAKSSR
jgi:Zn-dependent oligopeptidase